MNNQNISVYELLFDENLGSTIPSISVVEKPAIDEDFFAFSKRPSNKRADLFKDTAKRLITGPVLIPDRKLYRDQNNRKFFAFFSAETIQKIKEYIVANGSVKSNVEHENTEDDKPVLKDIILTEIWTKEGNHDKSSLYGFSHLPVGTLFVTYKVKDDAVWEDIANNKIKGFSIEGNFIPVPTNTVLNPVKAMRQKFSEYYEGLVEKEKQFVDTILLSMNFELVTSSNDYPQEATELAKKALKLAEENNLDCATLVGKARARQLANRENISIATIKRTYAYLTRAEEFYNPDDELACGTISYWYWGGEPMKDWAEKFLETLQEKMDFKLIEPKSGETEEEFIARGMSDEKMITEFPDETQRLAVLYSIYQNK